MNEAIRITLEVDGTPVGIDFLSSDGVVLSGETSASPRGLSINLQPGNTITQFRLKRVRMIRDWQPGVFPFNITPEGGALVCRGVDSLALPFGRYDLQLLISDLVPLDQPLDADVPENGEAKIVAPFRTDPRRVELTTPVDEFDDRIKAVVLDSRSLLDGQTIPAWLQGPARPRRKACLLNILAKARAAKGPKPKTNLLDAIQCIRLAEVDRIYVTAHADLLSYLRALAADPTKPFYFEGEPKAAMHKRLLDEIGPARQNLENDAAAFLLQSFRQEGKPCMQAVVAVPPGGDASRAHYADLDIDLGNPLQDLEGLFTHLGEVLNPGQTDHLKLFEKLSKGATADFLYYRVVRST